MYEDDQYFVALTEHVNVHFTTADRETDDSLRRNQQQKKKRVMAGSQMTDNVFPLETLKSHNKITDSICESNDHHSRRCRSLLAGNNEALSAPFAIQ